MGSALGQEGVVPSYQVESWPHKAQYCSYRENCIPPSAGASPVQERTDLSLEYSYQSFQLVQINVFAQNLENCTSFHRNDEKLQESSQRSEVLPF